MKISRNAAIGGFVVLVGILVFWFHFGTQSKPVGRYVGPSEQEQKARELAKRNSRNDATRIDHPEEWRWVAHIRYSTLGDGGRIGREVLEIAGLQPDDGPRVRAVFDRAFQKLEESLANRIRKTRTESEGTTVTEVYEIKGDSEFRDEVMKSLRDDLIANFGKGAAKILYEGFMPNSKYGGMGGRDIMVREGISVVPEGEPPSGSFSGNLYGKKPGDKVVGFRVMYRNSETEDWKRAFGGDERYFRNQYGNLVSHFGL
jgi:hypothetical protein